VTPLPPVSAEPPTEKERCPTCGGKGWLHRAGVGSREADGTCGACHGTGRASPPGAAAGSDTKETP
jgi:DnaJ-class molecular chaperone